MSSTSTIAVIEAAPPKLGRANEQQQATWPVMSKAQAIVLTLNLTFAMTLNIMSTQSVVIALPTIGHNLSIREVDLQWIISAYSLTFGCFLLLAGRLSDLFGHKYTFISGVSWFCVWSIGCGFAQDKFSLIIMRALQGIGAAASIPAAMGIIATSFPPGPSKSTAFACFSGGAALGGSLGTVFGGVLTTYTAPGWRSIFYVSAGMAAAIAITAVFTVPLDVRPSGGDRTVDWLGAALVTVGLILLTFVLADGQTASNGWATPYIPTLLILSIILIGAFIFWEHRLEYKTTKTPLMRVSLFKKGRFAVVQILTAFGWACFATHQFFVTLYYQQYMRYTPIQATIRFLPMSITGLILNFIVAVVASFAPAQLLIAIGALGTSLAPLLFAVMPTNVVYWQFEFPAMILTVLGADFIFAVGCMYGSKIASKDEQGLAGGVFNTVTQIGTAIGLAINTIIQVKVTQAETSRLGGVYDANDSSSIPPQALLKGLRAALFGCFAFGMVAFAIAILCLKGTGKVGEKAIAADESVKNEDITPAEMEGADKASLA